LTFNVFPLPQRSGFRKSFAFAGKAMDRGYHVLVFPEGRLSEDGKLRPLARGIGLLAAGLNAPVVPVKLEGLFELRQRPKRGFWALFLHPGTVSVAIGESVRFTPRQDPEVVTRQIEDVIASTRNL
jgi:long-chain acyl-CoA synthetase